MNHHKTVLRLRYRYIIGLTAIALLVTASFFTMQYVVYQQRGFSGLVNLAGHQAGLTNRIAYFSTIMATTRDEVEFEMAQGQVGRTIHKIRSAHETLRNGDPEEGLPLIQNENLITIYEDPTVGLDTALASFLERAETIYDSDFEKLSINSASYIFLTTYGPHVLEPLLDAAVDEYEQISRAAIVKIERTEFAIWVASIFTLLLELALIFIPLERRVRTTLKSQALSIAELTSTRERLLAAQQLALVGDWEMNLHTKTITWSDQIYTICGISRSEYPVIQDLALRFVHPEDRANVRASLVDLIRYEKPVGTEFRIVRQDGTERLVYQYGVVRYEEGGASKWVTATIQDITERRELSARLEKLSEHVPGFIFQFHRDNEGVLRLPYASRGILETCGLEREKLQQDLQPMFELLHSDDVEEVKMSLESSAEKLTRWHAQYRICHPQKGSIWLEGHATPERLIDGEVLWYGYIWDITQRKQSEDRIRRLALYDPLTGLANRRLLRDRLSHCLATSQRNENYGAVIMLDLDNFKSLNDTKGHEIGDMLLVEVSDRINSCVRSTDTVSRLGGDEFVVVLEWLGRNKRSAEKKSKDVAEKVRVALARPYYLNKDQHFHHGSASIGITLFKGSDNNESELLKRADVAMYEAKDLGRNRVCLFSDKRQDEIERKNTLAHDMQAALDKNEFSLYFQPQISGDGQLQGAEALLRWQPKGKAPISPGVFIPIAESNGQIISIGDWVLKRACQHLYNLEKLGLPDSFSIAVNISARQLNESDFLQKVKATIFQSNVDVNRLKFELTESSLVEDFERGNSILTVLTGMGISIELDDFGTGYSSLNSINRFPINTLKIDKSLVQGLESGTSTKAIVRATLAMAKAMGMNTIGEGVETVTQRDFLISEGCDMMQGFLYARPMPYDDFVKYLTSYTKKPSKAVIRTLPTLPLEIQKVAAVSQLN